MAETKQTFLKSISQNMEPKEISVVVGPLNVKQAHRERELGTANPGIGGTEFQF